MSTTKTFQVSQSAASQSAVSQSAVSYEERKVLIKEMNEKRKGMISELLTLVNPPKHMDEKTVIQITEEIETALATKANKPWEKGFSDHDLNYFVDSLKRNIGKNKDRIGDLEKADKELIIIGRDRLAGLDKVSRERHPVMRDHKELLRQIKSRNAFCDRAYGAIEVIQSEINRREEETRQYEEWKKRNEKIIRRLDPKLKKKVNKPAPRARNEVVLKGFGELVMRNRRQGLFSTEMPLKKAEAVEKIGSLNQLNEAFKNSGNYTFNDGSRIVRKKIGAVTRYFLQS